MANKLLDEAIEKYRIPQWPYEAVYDRIIVFSVPEEKATRETYTPGGLIVKTEARKDYEEAETPRGVLVSAGLGALDVLRGHGIGLGHMVWVARLSPWRHEVDRDADGKPIEFLFLRVGDIVGSETLQEALKRKSVWVENGDSGKHVYHCDDEHVRPRFDPPSWVA
jgi:hypothetical protein